MSRHTILGAVKTSKPGITNEAARDNGYLRAAIYVRVSSPGQVDNFSIDAQLRACRQICQDRGWQIIKEYIEPGESAKNDDIKKRPAFLRMMADAENHQFDVWVVHKLDRFARNLLLQLLCFQRLHNAHVTFLSVLEQADYTTPSGMLLLQVSGIVAEHFSRNLSQETKKGKRERKAQGLYNGLLPFGALKGEDKVPIPDPTNYQGLLLAFNAAALGKSDTEIARLLNEKGYRTTGNRGHNLWTKDSVRPMLINRFYLGELPDKGGWLPGKHEELVPEELFDRAQKARQINRTFTGSHTNGKGRTHSLTGLLRCWHCEHAEDKRPATMRIRIKGDDPPRVSCYGRDQGLECPQRSMYLSIYDEQIADWIAALTVPDDAVEQALERYAAQVKQSDDPEGERRQLENRLKRLAEVYQWGDVSKEDYLTQRDQLRVRLMALAPAKTQRRELEQLADTMRLICEYWHEFPPIRKNNQLRSFVQKIVIKDDQVETIIPRPEVENLLPEWASLIPLKRKRRDSLSSQGNRYSVPHNMLPEQKLRDIAEYSRMKSVRQAAKDLNTSRQTIRRAMELYG